MKCPGQETQYWKPGAIFEVDCPRCGSPVEFFKDDTTRRCTKCNHRFINPKMDFGCATYCQYAEQCLGNLPPELLAQKDNLLKDRVAIEIKRYFKNDFKRIGRATRVARYAEQIGKDARGNLGVVLPAAYLLDIGLTGSQSASNGSDHAGMQAAREILEKVGASGPLIEKICDIIAHRHGSGADEDLDAQIVHDADELENLAADWKKGSVDHRNLTARIESLFLTESGREKAKDLLLGESSERSHTQGNAHESGKKNHRNR